MTTPRPRVECPVCGREVVLTPKLHIGAHRYGGSWRQCAYRGAAKAESKAPAV